MSGKFMMNGIEYLGGGSGGGGGNVDDVYVNGESVLDENKVAQVTSYKEVTLAEYMALPDTKLTDGVMYCIKDVGGANQFPPLIYSDEEREVGVWRDGKPLYQRTFVKTLNSTSSPDGIGTAISSSEIPNCIVRHIEASWNTLPNGSEYVRYNKSWEGYANFWGIGDSSVTYNARWGTYASAEAVITIRYTKTTDTPGSGTWTTQGALAHHYSTEEHIIGTWIDGKPLYERVFDLGADVLVDYSAFTNTTINASQMKVLVDAWGIYSTGVTKYSLTANISNNIIRLQTDRNGAAASVRYVVLQYTKTTD